MKVTVIGVGNMGSAIIKGLLMSKQDSVSGMNPVNPRVSTFAAANGFPLYHTAEEVISQHPDVVILTTPAPVTLDVIRSFGDLDPQTAVISAAAGIRLADITALLPQNPIAAIIPNTPVAVCAGTIGLAYPHELPAPAYDRIHHVLNQLGDLITVPESQLDIIGVVGGCAPAFVDVFMDALSDAAVKYGLDRTTAYQLIASMVKGSGTLAAQSKLTPSQLRDQVTSPGGTTIRGVEALEKAGFRYAVIDAVNKANNN
ncbi:pyrroline-5-carboxylate reductase [Limosilactobacillus sp.]|uniref:pyrroline-5-carboxylate reductase n=1 Tax=Limosilactobacillus sp. TaxID=2773925 RepID=UPI003F07E192